MLTVRKRHKSFGRGTLRFLYPGNRKVLAYLREFEDETISLRLQRLARDPSGRARSFHLCRAHSGRSQWWLDLPADRPAPVSADPAAFRLLLVHPLDRCEPARLAPTGAGAPWPNSVPSCCAATSSRTSWSRTRAGCWKRRCRPIWRAVAGSPQKTNRSVRSACRWPNSIIDRALEIILAEVEESSLSHRTDHYLLPLAIAWEDGQTDALPQQLAAPTRVRRGRRVGFLTDAFAVDVLPLTVMRGRWRRSSRAAVGERRNPLSAHRARLAEIDLPAQVPEIRRLSAEQSNSLADHRRSRDLQAGATHVPGHPPRRRDGPLPDRARLRQYRAASR